MRRPILISTIAFLATFAWLLLPEWESSPALLWPSVLAVGLAFVTRDIYLSLFCGAFGGTILLHHGNVWVAFLDLFTERLIPVLSDGWNISVLVFTLLMGGFVEVLNRNGGMNALSARVMGQGGSARRVSLGAYWVGWLVFFDGLANALLAGKALRPMADRARLSREKLAFIVDSTSAPIAGLVLISTWVAYEMSLIRQGLAGTEALSSIGEGLEPFWLLVISLPFRFYNWYMLLLVFFVVWLMRDWGPMLEAENAARNKAAPEPERNERPAVPGSMALALVPLTVLVLGIGFGLFVDGGGLSQPLTLQSCVQAFGSADAGLVFLVATAVACAVALGISSLGSRPDRESAEGPREAFFMGVQQIFLPSMILVFAWMLSSVLKELGTAAYLVSVLGDRMAPGALPMLVFLLAAVVSFSTGTSWGTMAIIIPLVLPLAADLGGVVEARGPTAIFTATLGAVLAGAVFGDHCSPISDTTVVAAFSCDCDVMAHVRTQLPYALTAAGVGVLVGYGPVGLGVSPWLLMPVGGIVLWALVRFRGRPAG